MGFITKIKLDKKILIYIKLTLDYKHNEVLTTFEM